MSDVRDWVAEYGEDIVLFDGYDDCIIGVCVRAGQLPIVIYDYYSMIDKIIEDGASYDEAVDHFEHNIIGTYAGEFTPCFLVRAEHVSISIYAGSE